jgi:hypothetical protein
VCTGGREKTEAKKWEVAGVCPGELHNLYASLNIIRVNKPMRMKWTGGVARMRGLRNVRKVLVGKPEGKRPFRISRHTGVSNKMRMGLREIEWEVLYWIHLAPDRQHWRAGSYEKSNEIWVSIKGGKFLDRLLRKDCTPCTTAV